MNLKFFINQSIETRVKQQIITEVYTENEFSFISFYYLKYSFLLKTRL